MKNSILIWFEFFVWGVVLSATTVILYYITNFLASFQTDSNVYLFGILAGATGGVWGYGLTIAHETSKLLSDKESTEYHLWHRIVALIVALVILTIMGFISGLPQ
jgi:hypothetical protein